MIIKVYSMAEHASEIVKDNLKKCHYIFTDIIFFIGFLDREFSLLEHSFIAEACVHNKPTTVVISGSVRKEYTGL